MITTDDKKNESNQNTIEFIYTSGQYKNAIKNSRKSFHFRHELDRALLLLQLLLELLLFELVLSFRCKDVVAFVDFLFLKLW